MAMFLVMATFEERPDSGDANADRTWEGIAIIHAEDVDDAERRAEAGAPCEFSAHNIRVAREGEFLRLVKGGV